jgi:hypothetical protein
MGSVAAYLISPQVWMLWWWCGRLTIALKCHWNRRKLNDPRLIHSCGGPLFLLDAALAAERTMLGCWTSTIAGGFGPRTSEPPCASGEIRKTSLVAIFDAFTVAALTTPTFAAYLESPGAQLI